MATIHRPGPFSAFPGRQRILTLAGGDRLDLTIDGDTHRTTSYRTLAFDGAASAVAALPRGPVRALNVIFNPLAFRAEVQVADFAGSHTPFAPTHAVALEGELYAAGRRLEQFDTVLARGSEHPVEGRGRVACIAITPP